MKNKNFFFRLLAQGDNERPFFIFLTFIMTGIYIWAIKGSNVLNPPWRLIAFTVLMIGHTLLYWTIPYLKTRFPRLLSTLLIGQGMIAFTLAALSQAMIVIFGLYPGLMGFMIGLLRKSRWLIPGLIFYLILSVVNIALFLGWQSLSWWAIGMIPTSIFVAIYVWMYERQSDARQRAQALLQELEGANRQLTEYSARVEDLTITSERQRMARELHDTLSQGLAGLILQLEAVDAHLSNNRSKRAQSIVKLAMERARDILADARLAIDDLRRDEPADLESAVRLEAEHFSRATGIACNLNFSLPASLPEPVKEAALRAVSEGLTNIARHAHAEQAAIEITYNQDTLSIIIRDDGVGFEFNSVEPGHYGLIGMRERVRMAGGQLVVNSQPGKGTNLVISLPLEAAIHA